MGFKQKEGIDYLHSHSPVLNDSTIRILLSLILKSEYSMVIVEITKAFLESPLDKDNYIYVPPGYFELLDVEIDNNKVLKLNKSVYLLVKE